MKLNGRDFFANVFKMNLVSSPLPNGLNISRGMQVLFCWWDPNPQQNKRFSQFRKFSDVLRKKSSTCPKELRRFRSASSKPDGFADVQHFRSDLNDKR